MTDRHIHCVYFKYNAKNDLKGYCLLKQKRIKMGYSHHCPNIVLRPSVLLSYYIKNPDINWEEADNKAAEYINNGEFNDYPKREKEYVAIDDGKYTLNELVTKCNTLEEEKAQLKSDKEHLMGCLIRFFGYDDEDIDYNLNRESNREYGKAYYSMKEDTEKGL